VDAGERAACPQPPVEDVALLVLGVAHDEAVGRRRLPDGAHAVRDGRVPVLQGAGEDQHRPAPPRTHAVDPALRTGPGATGSGGEPRTVCERRPPALRTALSAAEALQVTRTARALLALAVVPALAVTAAPAAAATTSTTTTTTAVAVEAEAVQSSRLTVVTADPSASGRSARLLAPGASLTVRVSAPAAGSRLVVRLRTRSGAAAAAPTVTVDGRPAPALPVLGRTWRDHVVGTGHAAGTHTVTITEPATLPGRRRHSASLVDRVGFVPAPALAVTPATATPAAAPAPTAAATTSVPAPVDDAYETRIVQLVNAQRAAVRLAPLRVSTCADRYAEDWSATMARTSVFQHRPSLGTVMTACRASAVGENIAYGTVSADAMVSMWMNSPGHRANILSSRFTHIGVGAVRTTTGRVYGTQNFLRLG